MERAKLKMELIANEKSRNLSFKKRKASLIQKMHEFTTLYDVPACIIIQENSSKTPEIWPENRDQVHRLIKAKKKEGACSGSKTFGLDDFLSEKTGDELRKKKMEAAKYPTQPECINSMTEVQLRELAHVLSNKVEHVKCKIETLKRESLNKQQQQQGVMMDANNLMHCDNSPPRSSE